MNGLYFYKLVSPYPEDVTKNCKLTINEIDSNFLTLKDNDIKSAEFVRDEKILILTRNNGEKLIVVLDDATYDLNVKKDCGESGTTLTISYDGKNGKETVSVENILTVDNLSKVIGSDILTKVITDGTLKGNGTMTSPLGIVGVEKTGSLAPVQEVFDLTNGEKLPEKAKLGTRYVTKEYVSDYGYLYNGAGVKKIQQKLKDEFISDNTKKGDEKYAWRVPSKQDWDALLNSIEPKIDDCICRNHDSLDCHVELGCYAGKLLKSECGWCNQPQCECSSRKPGSGCENYSDDIEDDQIVPAYDPESPVGVDNYGMAILPAGYGTINRSNRPVYSEFGDKAFFWSTTQIMPGRQDIYVKVFDCDKSGVYQVAECPLPYYSVRLVKDYDGSNYRDSEYIDGILYKTILFPEAGQIWLASNYADTEGFIPYSVAGETPEYLNLGDQLLYDRRVEMFVNEWNGEYWEKRIMNDGETVVVQDPCYNGEGSGTTTTVVWYDGDGKAHEITVEIPKVAQTNIEYRVYTIDDYCNKDLINTDDLVVERVLNILIPMLEEERWERIKADEALSGAIETEREERISADTELWEALAEEASARTAADEALSGAIETEREERIAADEVLSGAIDDERAERESADTELWEALSAETEARISADTELWEALEAETERAISAETALDEKIDAEIERATEREDEIEQELFDEIERATERENEIDGQLIDWSKNPFTISAATEDDYNMVLPSKDENEDHFIKIKFDGNFGEI
jgi:uncharacterized protein (TIGR02145 family)